MNSLEIGDEIYNRFLAIKSQHKSQSTNEEFVQHLLSQFENCCSKMKCYGVHLNGVVNKSESGCLTGVSPVNGASSPSSSAAAHKQQQQPAVSEARFVCPECKKTTSELTTMEQHFVEQHEQLDGVFPCTCSVSFTRMSGFLTHYIQCPIAATDLHPPTAMDVEEDENDEDEEEDLEEEEDDMFDEEDDDDDEDDFDSGRRQQQARMQPPSAVAITTPTLTPQVEHDEYTYLDESIQPVTTLRAHSNAPINLVKNEASRDSNHHQGRHDSATSSGGTVSPSSGVVPLPYGTPSAAVLNPVLSQTPLMTGQIPQQVRTNGTGKSYDCEHCEKKFKSKGLLDQHKHLHYPPRHECEYCGRRFRWPPQFYTHKQQCSKRRQAILTGPAAHQQQQRNGMQASSVAEQLLLGSPSAATISNPHYGPRFDSMRHSKHTGFPMSTADFSHALQQSNSNNGGGSNNGSSGANNNGSNSGGNGAHQCMCGFKSSVASEVYEHKRSCLAPAARAMILQKLMDTKQQQQQSPPSHHHHQNTASSVAASAQSLLQAGGVNGAAAASLHSIVQNLMPYSAVVAAAALAGSSPPGGNGASNSGSVVTSNKPSNEEKPFECDFCESRFMTKISLKQHLDGKHSDQARYCCEKCGKGYFWNASYNYHKKKCVAVSPIKAEYSSH